MIETQVRALFTDIANSEPGSSRVDTQLAHRRGRARLRWRRACVASAPVVAAAAVAAVVLAVGATGPPRSAGPALAGPSAPRQFSPLSPYVSFGWLPAGMSLVDGGTGRQMVWINAGHTLDSPDVFSVGVDAAGKCHLTGPVSGPAGQPPARELRCSTTAQKGNPIRITGRAPAVDGRPAYWGSPWLVWRYARNGWAELTLPFRPRDSSAQRAAARADAVKIARQIRYGAPTPPLLFPVQLTHLPSRWQVSSVSYWPDGKVLRARSFALGAGPPNLGADGGLVYQTGLPYFTIDPFSRRSDHCGRGTAETINGYQVILTHLGVGSLVRRDLCAADADGLSIYISQFANHPAITVTDLFGHHMRLLGRHRANWTTNPVG